MCGGVTPLVRMLDMNSSAARLTACLQDVVQAIVRERRLRTE